MDPIQPTSFVHGANHITHYLLRCLVPYGLAYQFDPKQANRARPLSMMVILLSFTPILCLAVIKRIILMMVPSEDKQSDEFKAIFESVFIIRLSNIERMYRLILMFACFVIVFTQHGRISNVLAWGNNYITDKEQSYYAKRTLGFFCLNILSNTIAYSTVFMFLSNDPETTRGVLFYMGLVCVSCLLFWTRLNNCTPLIISCYLSSSLGRHVENFSTIYIDTMFDQFMKAIEKEGEESSNNYASQTLPPLPFFDDSGSSCDEFKLNDVGAEKVDHHHHHQRTHCITCCGTTLYRVWHLLINLLTFVYNLIRTIVIRLSMRRYPELPEMKMTKLSSTTKIQISDKTRTANNHLIRVRLRRTQVMLSDLRDLVSDTNKLSSPIVLIYLVFETMCLILVTTASVQAKVYKSISILILPTISVTISLASMVVYVCVCYDETTKQLRLLVNKLFDFIIMNHRVQSSGRPTNKLQTRPHYDPDEVCVLPGSEVGAINETWSQFQYTRKLANTIQFTMGGIIPITRRLVLSILGHVLSAVFISIEIMSIIDTMNAPVNAAGNAAAGPMEQNSTQSGNFTAYINHHHHDHHR